MAEPQPILAQAYDLIEKGQLGDAKELLATLLPEYNSNPDVWWLMAHATDNEEEGRQALEKVAELSPDYNGLYELNKELNQINKPLDNQGTVEKNVITRNRLLPIVLALIVIAGVLFVLFLVSQATTPTNTATPTIDVAIMPTTDSMIAIEVTATDTVMFEQSTLESSTVTTEPLQILPRLSEEVTATDIAILEITDPSLLITPSPIVEFVASVTSEPGIVNATPTQETLVAQADNAVPVSYDFLQGLIIPANGVLETPTGLSVKLCAIPGIAAGNAITELMMSISTGITVITPSVNKIEIVIVDCQNADEEQRVVQIDRAAIQAYADGASSLAKLQESIRPVR